MQGSNWDAVNTNKAEKKTKEEEKKNTIRIT